MMKPLKEINDNVEKDDLSFEKQPVISDFLSKK